MHEVKAIVRHKYGIHCRIAGILVKKAQQFPCSLMIEHNQSKADAKSILDVLSLAISKGSVLKILAKGKEAHNAASYLANLIESDFEMD